MTKVAVVTGAAGGMGRAFVAALMADGFEVVGMDLDAAGLAEVGEAQGAAFMPIQIDLTDADAVTRAFGVVAQTCGGVDVDVLFAPFVFV